MRNEDIWDKILMTKKILSDFEAEEMEIKTKKLRKEIGFRNNRV